MKKIIFLLICLSSLNAYAEDVTEAFSRCAITDNDKLRLACYDKIKNDIVKANAKAMQPANGYQPIDLGDLKVDLKMLVGKKIVVPALIQVMGEMSMLKTDEMDMAPIFSSADKLPRDDRKKLANGCQVILCKGQFYGVVRQLPLGLGIALDRVDWQ